MRPAAGTRVTTTLTRSHTYENGFVLVKWSIQFRPSHVYLYKQINLRIKNCHSMGWAKWREGIWFEWHDGVWEWMTPWWILVMWPRFDQSNVGFQRPVMPFCDARLSRWARYEWRTPDWGLPELMIIAGPGDGWRLSFKTLDKISEQAFN